MQVFQTTLQWCRESGEKGRGAPFSMALPEAGLMRTPGIEPYKQRSSKNVDLRSEI